MGHDMGGMLLRQLARLGGDEFHRCDEGAASLLDQRGCRSNEELHENFSAKMYKNSACAVRTERAYP